MSNKKSAIDHAANILDVHIVDFAAQLEALLRSVREIQRNILVLRGVLPRTASSPDAEIETRLRLMREECKALMDAINAATADAASLFPSTSAERL